jgi:transcription elongation factor Elf1
MAKATFKCPKCGNIKEIMFTVGTDAESVCDKCGTKMTRVWKNISTGTVVDDTLIEVGQRMLTASLPCGKDKLLY